MVNKLTLNQAKNEARRLRMPLSKDYFALSSSPKIVVKTT